MSFCPRPRRAAIDPPARLIFARGAMELVRNLLPATISTLLAASPFSGLSTIGVWARIWAMVVAAPALLAPAGMCATFETVAVKWMLIGRYRPGEHPLWSFFVWRDEIVNTCQEQRAGAWLLRTAIATPLLPLYLRTMSAKVGHDVSCGTERRSGCDGGRADPQQPTVEQVGLVDRLPVDRAAAATLGPHAAVLPDTAVGIGSTVAGRSIVMGGDRLPAHTRWHGAPVVAV